MKLKCKKCKIDLTDDLKEVFGKGQLMEIDKQDFIPRGHYFISDGEYYTGTENKIIICKSDLINSKNHTDHSRLGGCCGLDGTSGPNKLCINGHEVATEKSDCWHAHSIIFEKELIIQV
jgi:hypothetical protein